MHLSTVTIANASTWDIELFIMCCHRTVFIIFNIYVLIQIDLFIMLLSILKSRVHLILSCLFKEPHLFFRRCCHSPYVYVLAFLFYTLGVLSATLYFHGAMNISIRTQFTQSVCFKIARAFAANAAIAINTYCHYAN